SVVLVMASVIVAAGSLHSTAASWGSSQGATAAQPCVNHNNGVASVVLVMARVVLVMARASVVVAWLHSTAASLGSNRGATAAKLCAHPDNFPDSARLVMSQSVVLVMAWARIAAASLASLGSRWAATTTNV